MSDPILSLPALKDTPAETAGRFSGTNLLPLLLLIPLLLRGRGHDGIFPFGTAGADGQGKPAITIPKIFKTNDFLEILGAVEPHFHGYRQEFVNALMGIMDVQSSIRSLRHHRGGQSQSAPETSAHSGPDPLSIFHSLVPFMSDEIRTPAERYINVIGSARGLMQQWRNAGGLFPNGQSGAGNPLMGLLSTLVPGSESIAQAFQTYQAMHQSPAETPGHDEGSEGASNRDTHGSIARLLELSREMSGGMGRGSAPADFASLLSRLRTS